MFRLIQDDDGHWYVVKKELEKEFNEWVRFYSLDFQEKLEELKIKNIQWIGADFEFCRVNGPHSVLFENWKEV